MEFVPKGPETPDPVQLELFDTISNSGPEPKPQTAKPADSLSNDLHIRSPTEDLPVTPENGRNFELNEAQKSFASSLHGKSRELVKKSIEIKNSENDLARP